MSQLVQLLEPTAGRLTVPFRVFLSNGTAPDTGLSNDSLRISFNGASEVTALNKISAISAAAGMYAYQLSTPSEVSVLGTVALSYEQGDFPQHVATINVVAFDPYGATLASFGSTLQSGSSSAVSLASKETSTNSWFNGAQIIFQYPTGNVIADEISLYTGATFSAQLKNLLPIAPSSAVSYWIIPGTYNDISVQTIGAVNSAVTIANADYSAVTVRIKPLAYSGLTVEINNAVGDVSSRFTVAVSQIAAATYSGVTVGINNAAGDVSSRFTTAVSQIAKASYSGVTVGIDNIKAATYSGVSVGAADIDNSASTKIADVVLDRNLTTGIDSTSSTVRTARGALRALRNRVDSDATQLYVYKEDDTSISWTASKSTTANLIFLTGFDPNG